MIDRTDELNEYNFQSGGYRPIPGWPDYVMSAGLDVWSLPRRVACKSGAMRQKAAKQLKHSNDGRVALCRNGKPHRYHVARDLFPDAFPDLLALQREAQRQRPQAICRHGHPLMDFEHEVLKGWMDPKPLLASWGTGNRICLHCTDAAATYPTDNTYSLQHGVDGMPDYPRRPLRSKIWNDGPQLRGGNRLQLAELEWDDHGFTISNSP